MGVGIALFSASGAWADTCLGAAKQVTDAPVTTPAPMKDSAPADSSAMPAPTPFSIVWYSDTQDMAYTWP